MLNYSAIRKVRYGELNIKELHPEVKKIWYSRNEELPLLPEIELELDIIDHEEPINFVSLKEIICGVLDKLTKKERLNLVARFNLDMTFEDIGITLSLSKERIRQIEAKTIRKMSHPFIRETLEKVLPNSLVHSDNWFRRYNEKRKENI